MMPDLVQDGAFQKILCRDVPGLPFPPDLIPGQPVPHLGIAREQQYLVLGGQFDGQHHAGVVGVGIELQRQLAGSAGPVCINRPPGFALVFAAHFLDVRFIGVAFIGSAEGLETFFCRGGVPPHRG